MSGRVAGYTRKPNPGALTRLIAVIPKQEADSLDAWGIAAGMPSRTAAIRFLIARGLETAAAEQAREA